MTSGEAGPQVRQQFQRNHWNVGNGETLVRVVQVRDERPRVCPAKPDVHHRDDRPGGKTQHVEAGGYELGGAPNVVAVRHAPPRPARPSASV